MEKWAAEGGMREMEGSGDERERNGGNGFVSANAETHNQRNASLLTVNLQACVFAEKKNENGLPWRDSSLIISWSR